MSNITNYINIVKNLIKVKNISNHTLLNKTHANYKYNISSNDLISERNKKLIFKMFQRDDYNFKPINKMNKSNLVLNNNKDEYTQSDFNLNKSPLNIVNNISTIGKEDYFFKAKRTKNITDNSKNDNDSISLSKLYKLPALLKNEKNTIRKLISYRLKKKETKKERALKYHPIPNLSIDTSKDKKKLDINEKMSETMGYINKGNNKNVSINLIGYNKVSVKNNLKPIKIIKNLSPFDDCKINELKNFMKDRFYVDTEIKMKKKLKNTNFSIDNSLKNKIIELNKIGDFWKGVFDYCSPVINLKRYKCSKDMFNGHKIMKKKSKTFNEVQKQNLSDNKMNTKSELKSPRLFTINSFADYRHQKKLETKMEFFKKYNNDSLQYYLF